MKPILDLFRKNAGEYLRRTSACSCCSWCFFSGLAVMMCAMAGCIVVAYSQLGGFCLELHSDAKADLFRTTGLSQHMADMHALDVLGILQVTSSCLPKEGSPATDVFALLQASPSGPSVREVLSDFTGRMPTALPEISELRRYVAQWRNHSEVNFQVFFLIQYLPNTFSNISRICFPIGRFQFHRLSVLKICRSCLEAQ